MLLINKGDFVLQSDRRVVKAADVATVRSAAEIVAAAFFCDYVPVNFACSHIGVNRQILVYETLIVTEVKVGLRAVVGNEYLAMLER